MSTINILKPRQALNKAFLKVKPNRNEIKDFRTNLITLLDRTNETESEEFHKNLVSDFLKETYYKHNHFINTKERMDLVIHNGDETTSVGVIIEAKKLTNRAEMLTKENFNVKALHELVLYYMRERITANNIEIKHVIATNIYEWFIFDATLFDRLFAQNKTFEKQFEDFENGRLADTTTEFFYKEVAEPFIADIQENIEFAYFDIRDYEEYLKSSDNKGDNRLIALFKIFSPEHLLKLPFVNDSNSLDKRFYSELLHIIGLIETKEGSKKLIERRKDGDRHTGTIIEDAIIELDNLDRLSRLEKPNQFGSTPQERLFNVALELSITWINRILFLKLLEAQLIAYHKGDKSFSFLHFDKIKNYHDLNNLFFQVLARKYDERNEDVKTEYEKIPYLNSSLFEPTEIEKDILFISNLNNDKTIPIFAQTVLKDSLGKKRSGHINTLQYLFEFLDAYDFGAEGSEEIQEENKTLINASVLGLIFEKINGYKDGSFFTPGFITMYMCRETIRKAVIQKFNEEKGWNCTDLKTLHNNIEVKDINEANRIINDLKICDPAVGSGHFLVSALNEIIAIKSELKILQDREGRILRGYEAKVINDELIITDFEGELFEYNPQNSESQRIQEALFHEKQTIIENCLFGVDINTNSVNICRLRLWIELLKNAYYKNETELETLPNIDINIKCGNSLISRFAIDSDLKQALKKSKWSIENYQIAVDTYRNAENKEQKKEMEGLIADIKSDFRSEISLNDPKAKRLRALKGKLHTLTNQGQFFELTEKEKKDWNKKVDEVTAEVQKLETEIEEIKSNKIFENAFEWRFEFPEVLNDVGDFVGFDVVIGNPPYIKEYEGREIFDGLRDNEVYLGKMDIWYMFAADGIKLLKDSGHLNFIAQNNWVTSSGAQKFRNFLLDNAKIEKLVDFGSYMVFDSASIQTMIMLFSKQKTDNYKFTYKKLLGDSLSQNAALDLIHSNENINAEYLSPIINKGYYYNTMFTFQSSGVNKILNKMVEKSNFKLESIEIANGIHPHHDFVTKKMLKDLKQDVKVGDGIFGLSQDELLNLNINENEYKLIKPYFNSKQFFRYYANRKNENWLIYTGSEFNNPEKMEPYPNLKNHLDKFQSVITSSNKPYGLHRARVEDFFIGEKIIVTRKCSDKPIFTYTNFDTYVSATFYVIKTNRINQKVLIGILNSRLIEFWLFHKGKMQGTNYQLDKEPLLELPIITPNDELQTKIEQVVDAILSAKEHNQDTTALEAEIDQLVYQLYELTEEEIKIIEEG